MESRLTFSNTPRCWTDNLDITGSTCSAKHASGGGNSRLNQIWALISHTQLSTPMKCHLKGLYQSIRFHKNYNPTAKLFVIFFDWSKQLSLSTTLCHGLYHKYNSRLILESCFRSLIKGRAFATSQIHFGVSYRLLMLNSLYAKPYLFPDCGVLS